MPHVTIQLTQHGPILDALVGVSGPRQQALQKAGQQVPPPIPVRCLVDTGATGTVIDQQVLAQLPLMPTGTQQIHTPSTGGTPHAVNQYDVSLWIAVRGGFRPFPALPVIASMLAAQGIMGLLGRDVLEECLFVYNGPDNVFTLAI